MSQGILSSSEKLSLLLDGELQSAEASTLFYELAQNVDLQEEMKEHLMLRKMFSGPQPSPPRHLKKSILLGAGLSTTLGAASAGTSSALTWAAGNLLKSKGLLIGASAIIGSLITLFIMGENPEPREIPIISSSSVVMEEKTNDIASLMFPGELRELDVISDAENVNAAENSPVNSTANVNPPVQGVNLSQNSQAPVSPVVVLLDEEIAEEDSRPVEENEFIVPESQTTDNEKIRTVLISVAYPYDNTIYTNLPSNFMRNSLQSKVWLKDALPIYKKLSLHLRGFAARSIPQMDIEPLDSPTLNNLAMGLFYKLNESSSIGIEVGQESFLQRYGGVVRNSPEEYNIEFEQNYIAFWMGLAYHHEFSEIEQFGNIKPILRAVVGGTRVGPIGRGTLGFQYDLEDRISFFTGMELTTLFYRYQEELFNTTKVGVTLGTAVRF